MNPMQLKYNHFYTDGAQYLPGGFDELCRILEQARNEKKQLRVKLGIDPTSTDLHLGHTVCLQFLRKFREEGHKIALIIGDFTATIGDPSGRDEARPPLTQEQAKKNAQTYLKQARKIISDLSDDEVHYNSKWLSNLSSKELLKLAHIVTVNRLISKEAFGTRIEKSEPLYLHEVLYPILQGYDSVADEVNADIEIGGIDQTYNVLFGRDVQRFYKKKEQFVVLLPLLIGLDGKKKMSKSFNNYIALEDTPNEIFGKAMSIPDELIMHYFKLVSDLCAEDLSKLDQRLQSNENPRDIKMLLAHHLLRQLHGEKEASKAQENFINQFQKNEIPETVDEYSLDEPLKIIDLMHKSGLVLSKAEAKRLIEGGGVKLKSTKVNDPNFLVTKDDKNSVLQIGKRKFIKIV